MEIYQNSFINSYKYDALFMVNLLKATDIVIHSNDFQHRTIFAFNEDINDNGDRFLYQFYLFNIEFNNNRIGSDGSVILEYIGILLKKRRIEVNSFVSDVANTNSKSTPAALFEISNCYYVVLRNFEIKTLVIPTISIVSEAYYMIA